MVRMADSISERLDALLEEIPDEAISISHDPDSDYRVCTIVIDWRKVPGQGPPPRLRAVEETGR
jgi:hypothetical protein